MADEMTDEELRRAVAERLGWKWWRIKIGGTYCRFFSRDKMLWGQSFPVADGSEEIVGPEVDIPPRFAASIADAWTLVEEAKKREWRVEVGLDAGRWTCGMGPKGPSLDGPWEAFAWETSAPRAICLAFLKMTKVAAHG